MAGPATGVAVPRPAYNVLFLSATNATRSIMAEALLRTLGADRFRAFSAGSAAEGRVHTMALRVLAESGCPIAGLRSKGWEEFCGERAPAIDFVITVCETAVGMRPPAFRGRPVHAHWDVSDPAAIEGAEEARLLAFRDALGVLRRRVQHFTSLPFESIDKLALKGALREIGELA